METCKTCRFFSYFPKDDEEAYPGTGDCRRYPPAADYHPTTHENTWCGEWQAAKVKTKRETYSFSLPEDEAEALMSYYRKRDGIARDIEELSKMAHNAEILAKVCAPPPWEKVRKR